MVRDALKGVLVSKKEFLIQCYYDYSSEQNNFQMLLVNLFLVCASLYQ